MFYQTALLGGYFYARTLARYFRPKTQTLVHLLLLAASLLWLPIGPGENWVRRGASDPSWLICGMLAATVGLPFVALSATSPLLQAWLARSGFRTPYRMFAVSNFASLAALLAYPTLIESTLGTKEQSIWWSFGYAGFTLLCGTAAWRSRNWDAAINTNSPEAIHTTGLRKAQWFALATCGSMLLLAVTNHIDENVAAVPLIWILPLAVYLLSFVFSFGAVNIYRRTLWLRLLAFALGILGYAIYNIDAQIAMEVNVPLFLGGLFICCLFCHGELHRLRPPAQALTDFYLVIAAGGAAGAIFVGLVAPRIFAGIYELPLTLVFTALLALLSTWNGGTWTSRLLWMAVTGCMAAVTAMNVQAYRANSVSLRRSFYGSLRVVQTQHAGPEQQRILFHGTIEHGAQFLLAPQRSRPTTYYGPDSGAGILLRECYTGKKRVAVIGLGAGTLAVYGHSGDVFQFFEINSQVADIAQGLFFYLRETSAQAPITIGDGRLSLERDKSAPFDAIVLDAFSGDAIPVHLLTREAMALYARHLTTGGTMAFHVSNDYLDLSPVVKQLAENAGYLSVLVHSHADLDEATLPADWVLVTKNASVLENASIRVHSRTIGSRPGLRLWTDDFSDVWSAFKKVHLPADERPQ